MSSKNIIRVSEFEKLYYDLEEKKPFQQKHWEALCKYLENVNKKEEKRVDYFRILNKGIQFTNYVGVIQAGNLTIEVLPKIDRDKRTAANETVEQLEKDDKGTSASKQTWHNVLLQMLRECSLLKVNHIDYANLNLKSNSILEVYLDLFLNEVEKLVHEGLIKKYKKTEGNKLALKGQLLFSKNISVNFIHKERFFVRHTEYNRDNIFNKLLYKTILLIPQISSSSWLSDKVNRLLLNFPELPDIKVSATTFNKLVFDRKTERYKEAMLISKMLLLNYRPDISGGTENVIAILFDMNKLWEEFVYRRLKKEEKQFDISVHRQQSEDFWKPTGGRTKTIRPDIVINTASKRTIIVDTKWKLVEYMLPGDDDLKQMYIYNLFWTCEKSILLYPAVKPDNKYGDYYDYRNKGKHFGKCFIQTTCVLSKENKLDDQFGINVLNQLI